MVCILSIMTKADLPVVAQQQKTPPVAFVQGRLVYTPDSAGNRIPDFSYAGYMAGEQEIPDAPVRIVVPWKKGDAWSRIQSAIDYVAKLPADQHGIRGAVLLEKGVYELSGGLHIVGSGVVLRGSGMGNNGTTLFANNTSRETVITVSGEDDREVSTPIQVADVYVPVNSNRLNLSSAGSLKPGDMIQV